MAIKYPIVLCLLFSSFWHGHLFASESEFNVERQDYQSQESVNGIRELGNRHNSEQNDNARPESSDEHEYEHEHEHEHEDEAYAAPIEDIPFWLQMALCVLMLRILFKDKHKAIRPSNRHGT